MEKDIKILKELAQFGNDRDILAIENILNRLEEFKARIEILNESNELKIDKIQQLEKENVSKQKAYDDCYCEFKHYKQFDSIPKSVIRYEIEELDNMIDKISKGSLQKYTVREIIYYKTILKKY